MAGVERKARILIVEDESIVALDMRNQLTDLGFEVVGLASSGEEAVALAGEHRPDLVLMDIRLKGDMDGVEAAERIRGKRDVPIIFITAYADERTLSRAKVTQAFGYILKPFQGREVLISIEMALYKHRIECELRESREWLKGTLDAITDAVIALDSDDRIEFMNRAAEAFFSIEDGISRGRSMGELCSFSVNPALSALFANHREGGAKGDASWVMLELPTRKVPVELVRTAIPGRAEDGNSGSVLAFRDISELVRAVEMRSRLAAIVANSYDAILAVGPDLGIVSWNFGAELIYGYAGAEVIGKSLLDLVPDEQDKNELRVIADRVLAGHEAERFDSVRKCRSGKIVPVSMSLSPVRDAEGRVVELACIERDVSAEKEYEASLVKAKLAAEEASRAKSEFLSNMSHELRTPLNSILGMIDLSHDCSASSEQREYLEIARQSADNLLLIINSILDFSKIESGKMHINEIPFNLTETVADCLGSVSVQAYRKGLHLFFRFDPACPNRVIGDPYRLSQILLNLVSNGIKFTETGGVDIDVSFSRRANGKDLLVKFTVRDTGIGIPHDRLNTIWDKFTQLDGSSTRSYGGTGLGLAIVKSLVALMRGSVRVESEPNRGSSFVFEIPLTEAADASATAVRIPRLANHAVVVASSESTERGILSELLTAWGCVPLEVRNARELLERLSPSDGYSPLLILVDEGLPESELLFACSEDEDCIKLLRSRLVVLTDGVGRKKPLWNGIPETTRSLQRPVHYRELLSMLLAECGSPPEGEGAAVAEVPARVRDGPKSEENEADAAFRRIDEVKTDPAVRDTVTRFFKEIASFGGTPYNRLETSAQRYRKVLEDLRTHELPRSLFRVILACRRDDAEGVEAGLEAIRSALRADEHTGRLNGRER